MVSLDFVLLILSVICLLLSAFGYPPPAEGRPRVSLLSLGLTLFVLTFLTP